MHRRQLKRHRQIDAMKVSREELLMKLVAARSRARSDWRQSRRRRSRTPLAVLYPAHRHRSALEKFAAVQLAHY
jgi:hypothetical protein